MQTLLPIIGVFAVFSPALMLPGPDFVAVVRNTIARGKRAGIMTAAGVSIGITLYAAASALGLSALLNRIDGLELIVRTAGALFLTYLGARLLLTKTRPQHLEQSVSKTPPGHTNPLMMGLLVNLTNPKAIIFFTSIFGSAIRPQTPLWVLIAVIAVVGLSGFLWFSTVSLLTASTGWLIRLEDHQHWIERLAGIAFVGFAAKIGIDLF